MKKVLQQFYGKILILVSLLCAFAYTGNGQAHITISTANCTVATDEVQVDVMVTNDGSGANLQDLRWNGCVIRVVWPAAMFQTVPALASQTFTFTYVGGSDFPLSFGNGPGAQAAGAVWTPASRTLTWTSTPSAAYSNLTCQAPLIAAGATMKIGRFSFKRTDAGGFVTGQSASFTWATTASCNLYLTSPSCSPTTTGFSTATLRAFGTVCPLTVPSACAVTGTATTTSPTCFGGTNGTATVTLAGTGSGAPGTYTVDGGGSLPYSSNPFTVSGLSAGPHTIVATVTGGGCVSSNISANVSATAALTGSATTTAVSCFGSTDGTATVTLSASTAGTYTVDGGSSVAYSSNPFTVNGLAAGAHSIVATSAAGCVSGSISASVGNVAALTGSASGTSVSCFGSTDGTATVTLSTSTSGTYTVDGGSPVSYNSNPFTVNGLAAGNHTIVATSSPSNCVSNLIGVSVGDVAQLTGSATTTPTTCGSGGNGTATVTLSSSTSGTYTVDGGSSIAYSTNPFTVTGLTAGPHTIVATASAGCVSSNIIANVGGSSTFTATYVVTNISACNAVNDGTITVTPNGGTAPYTYVWSGGYPGFAPGNVSAVTGLPIGYYNVTVTDAGGCGVVTFTNIHIGFAFTVYITNSGSSTNSCGGSTGSIILYGNAGVQPYTYSLNGVNYQASNTFTGLAAGPYTAYVKDAAGCVGTKAITVNASAPIVVNPFATGASSCAPDGSIHIFLSGGAPPYSYSLNGTTYQPSPVFSGLAAGPYTAYVKDASGCVGTAPVTVAAGVGLSVTVSKVNTSSCVNDGSIQVNAAGGVAPYTYSKDNGVTYQASNSFPGLGAGNYAIKVKDFKGCTSTVVNVTISTNSITVTASATAAASCTSNDGKIQLFRTGGYGPYTYSIDGNSYQASTIFTGVPAGTYTGYVKDAQTCIGFLPGIVVNPTGCPMTFAGTTNAKQGQSVAVVSERKVQAYPNPSQSEFTLVLEGYDNQAKVSITVTDLLGRKVYQTEGTGKSQYRFGTGFIAGMYNVQVIQGTEKKSLKVVKE